MIRRKNAIYQCNRYTDFNYIAWPPHLLFVDHALSRLCVLVLRIIQRLSVLNVPRPVPLFFRLLRRPVDLTRQLTAMRDESDVEKNT